MSPSSSADCAERRTAALFLSLKASAAIGLMDERIELVVFHYLLVESLD